MKLTKNWEIECVYTYIYIYIYIYIMKVLQIKKYLDFTISDGMFEV